ncbi:mCG1735, isoform CRA_c [Mus musculus]|nr:mCG1735, isoform CRA_c [Mus musculus]
MLGQSIRRFTTSVVRRSHYEEGPGKWKTSGGCWL